MVLKLDDGLPLVWRTPTSVQIGVDAPVVIIEDVSAGVERLLAALRSGISESGWAMLTKDSATSADEAQRLLDVLHPAMQVPRLPASARALVTGDGPIAFALAALLRDAGVLAPTDEKRPDVAVLVADWVLGPHDAAAWLRQDVPHLPVVAADRSVTVGPLVEPGAGPCIYCVQLARTDADADAAWPAVSAQLWGRAAPPRSQLTVQSAATFAARVVLARLRDGPAEAPHGWHLANEGVAVTSWTARTHPRCSCAALPESDWAPGSGRAGPAATMTSPGAAGRG